ncbi:MAG: fructose-1,6-bisphosphatase [Lachnospiraceae bacterium]|nr:fructose-1,6-bisphosphatase [Lachnospiraceae bacterium]
MTVENMEQRYLMRMSELYPTIARASTEIINLSSILNLPKGTEHFITDIHGEYEAFSHVLRNGSGAVRKKINELYARSLPERDIKDLATLIYYPSEKIALVKKEIQDPDELDNWYKVMLYRLVEVCKYTASKYTRSKVRKAMTEDFAYVIDELITERADIADKEAYYDEIVSTIIRIGRSDQFIKAIAELIRRLVVDHLHILGDIYDRGYGPDDIMDALMDYHSLDIQWGNHDVEWMGAAVGQPALVACVVRFCVRYGNLGILEDGYGINLLPLAQFAEKTYGDDPCECFKLKSNEIRGEETELNVRIHKAISVIQFKLEGQLVEKRKEFDMADRNLFSKVDFDTYEIRIGDQKYPMKDHNFPTIDPEDPNRLSPEEEYVMERLIGAFTSCKRLQEHMQFLLRKGELYTVYNGNLMFHGCMPLTEDGHFKEVRVYNKTLKGRALYDYLDTLVRRAFFSMNPRHVEEGKDILWWIWCNKDSPLFGKDKMATFERYFIDDPKTHEEKKTPYYNLLDDEEVINRILAEFGLHGNHTHIINGHVPVKRGQTPTHCGGRVLVIDGGFSKAYQGTTGIAGYTLIYNSWGMRLVAHKPFTSMEDAVESGTDIHSDNVMVESFSKRLCVGDTDAGNQLRESIRELETLLAAYRSGDIVERQ